MQGIGCPALRSLARAGGSRCRLTLFLILLFFLPAFFFAIEWIV